MGKIFFISDSHMGYLIYANRPRINRDTYRALLSVANYIAEDPEEEKAVIFCGDNLDSKSPCPSDIQALKAAIKVLTDADIPVFGIEGNHDKVAARKMAGEDDPEDLSAPYGDCKWIDLVDGMNSINKQTVTIKSKKNDKTVSIHGLDYVQGKQIYEELDKIPECDILVMHQPFMHVSPFEAHALEVEGVPECVHKAVVFGHVHIADKRQTSNNVWVVSPGATHAQKLTHPHGTFAVYDIDTELFEFIQTPVHRDMFRFVCDTEDNMVSVEECLEEYASEDDKVKPIVGIKYKEDLGGLVARIEDKYTDTAHIFPHIVRNVTDQVTAEEVVDLSPKEILDKLFLNLGFDKDGDDQDLYEQALSMIEGHPEKVFEYIAKLEDKRNEINKISTA